jgi:hypothetical protein
LDLSYAIKLRQFQNPKAGIPSWKIEEVMEAYRVLTVKKTRKAYHKIYRQSDRSNSELITSQHNEQLENEFEQIQQEIKAGFDQMLAQRPSVWFPMARIMLVSLSFSFVITLVLFILTLLGEDEGILGELVREIWLFCANLLFILGTIFYLFGDMTGVVMMAGAGVFVAIAIIQLYRRYLIT